MRPILKKIYTATPIWFQNLMVSNYGKKLYKQRYSGYYYESFKTLIAKDYSNFSSEIEIQRQKMVELVNFAFNNSPFYHHLYKDIDISTIIKLEDLKLLPIVDKELLRQNIDQVYTISEKDGIPSYTGGTTGKTLKVIYDPKDFQWRMAYLDAFKTRLGIDTFNSRKATFSGRDIVKESNSKIFWRNNKFYNQRLYSTFHLTDDNIPYYIEDLNKFKPEVLNGFVSALYDLADFIYRNSVKLSFQLKAIFTTSESLLPMHRSLIENVFNAKVYNQYASAEGAPFITECKFGNLHYNLDTGVIETLDTDAGTQMLITSFTTHGTPLIRYNIGDLIKFKEGNCSCGNCHPLVESIEGRKVDFLISKTKGKISLSHLADVIKGIPNSVKKMQFIQSSIDKIDILIVVDNSLFTKQHELDIMKEMRYRFGDAAEILLHRVEDIPREKSGKFSLIKNKIMK